HSPVCSFFVLSLPSTSTLFPYTTLFRSRGSEDLEVGLERPQYARVRGRQVDVASPNPRPLPLDETDHRSRLGIVDDHRIEVVPESGRIRFVHPPVFGLQLRRQSDRRTLERVVDRLRRVVEPR